jgi:hypothetical protein
MPGKDAWLLPLADAAGVAVGAVWRALPALLGVGLVSFGAWLAWPPGGFMTAGVLVLADLVADRVAGKGRPQ